MLFFSLIICVLQSKKDVFITQLNAFVSPMNQDNRSYSQKEPDVFKKGLVLFLKELDV